MTTTGTLIRHNNLLYKKVFLIPKMESKGYETADSRQQTAAD
jgi:hypothetical protein